MPNKPKPNKMYGTMKRTTATRAAVANRKGSEGPKRSVAKPTVAQSVAAKKRSAVKKSAAEGPKRSTSKPSATAMAIAKSNPKVVESGVGNLPLSVIRAAKTIADYTGKGPKLPSTKPRVSSDPMRNKKAPKKTNDQLFNEYYKNYKQPPKRG